jgi:hypothetical protein
MLQHLCLANAVILLSMSTMFEARHMLDTTRVQLGVHPICLMCSFLPVSVKHSVPPLSGLRATFVRTMQAVSPEGFNLAETLQHLCLANGAHLLRMSAVFGGKHMLNTALGTATIVF